MTLINFSALILLFHLVPTMSPPFPQARPFPERMSAPIPSTDPSSPPFTSLPSSPKDSRNFLPPFQTQSYNFEKNQCSQSLYYFALPSKHHFFCLTKVGFSLPTLVSWPKRILVNLNQLGQPRKQRLKQKFERNDIN